MNENQTFELNNINFSSLNSVKSDLSFIDRRQNQIVFGSIIGYHSLISLSLSELDFSTSNATISRYGTIGISKLGYNKEIRTIKDYEQVHAMFCIKDNVIQSEDGDDTIDFAVIYDSKGLTEQEKEKYLIDQTYKKLDKYSIIPMIKEWSSYIYTRLKSNSRLYQLTKMTNNNSCTMEAIRLRVPNSYIRQIIEEGLKNKSININGFNNKSLIMEDINGLDSYLTSFGEILAEKIQNSFRPKFVPGEDIYSQSTNDVDDYFHSNSGCKKELYDAQKSLVQASVNNLNINNSTYIISEMGTGKTLQASAITYAHHNQKNTQTKRGLNSIVMCPSHLVFKWAREIEESIPNAKSFVINNIDDLIKLESRLRNKNKKENTYIVVSKESAKLTYIKRPAAIWSKIKKAFVCPECNQVLTKEVTVEIHGKKQKVDVPLTKEDFMKEYKYNLVCTNKIKKLNKSENVYDYKLCNAKLWTTSNKDENNPRWIKIGKHGWLYKEHIPELTSHYATRPTKLNKVESQLFTELFELNSILEDNNNDMNSIGVKYHGSKKVSVSTYIRKRMKNVFDYVLIDEVHAMLNDSLQGNAAGDLIRSCDKSLLLTGTLLNGYAENLFYILYRTNPRTMKEDGYNYNDIAKFSKDYGVHSREYSIEFNTNRRTGNKTKKLPGVSPLVFTNFLMDNAVFLSLSDMSEGLPEYTEIPLPVRLDSDIFEHYGEFERKFRNNAGIQKGKSRKHITTMLQALTTYPDAPHCAKPIYGENKDTNEVELIYEPKVINKRISEKEYRLLELVKEKLANDEKVLVYYTNVGTTDIGENLNKLFKENNITSYELKASVPPNKREDWVENHVNNKGMEVMICNPSLVETGLDLLDFTTIVFYQMGYSLFTMRQASRRSWRLSQTKPKIEVYFMYYVNTIQEQIVSLMANKLQAAMAIEGKFSEEGLKAMSNNEDMLTQIANNVVNGIKETVNQDIFKATDFKTSKDKEKRIHLKTSKDLTLKLNNLGEKSLFSDAIKVKYNSLKKTKKTKQIIPIDNVMDLFC